MQANLCTYARLRLNVCLPEFILPGWRERECLNWNIPHRMICLNTWSPVGGAVLRDYWSFRTWGRDHASNHWEWFTTGSATSSLPLDSPRCNMLSQLTELLWLLPPLQTVVRASQLSCVAPKTMGQNKLFILHIASLFFCLQWCVIYVICDMWCMWDHSKAHRLHYLSVWQVSQQLPWRGKLEMSIPLFTNSIKKMHFLKVCKRKSAFPFRKLPGTSLPFSPWSLPFFFLCSFNSPTINIYLCQILSALLFPSLFLWSSRVGKIPCISMSLEVKQMREETK